MPFDKCQKEDVAWYGLNDEFKSKISFCYLF